MIGKVGSCSYKQEESKVRYKYVKICKICFIKKLGLFMRIV